MMKIGIDGVALTTPYHCGTRHYAENLVRQLATNYPSHEYVVFMPKRKHQALPRKVKAVYYPNLPLLKKQLFLPYLVAREQVDIFHYLEPFGSYLLFHPRIVTTIHDSNLSQTYPLLSKHFLNRIHCELTRMVTYMRSKRVITPSQFVKEELMVRFAVKKPVDVCLNGYDAQVFFPASHLSKESYFLTIGDFAARKNVLFTLRAFGRYRKKYLSKMRMKIVVSSQSFMRPIQEEVRGLGLEKWIELVANVSDEELRRHYQLATGFYYLSLYEGFGLPIIEAMACGCPVVTSNFGAMKETAGDSALLVSPTSYDETVETMRLLETTTTGKRLIQKGFEQAGRFSWQNTARKVMQVYKKLI